SAITVAAAMCQPFHLRPTALPSLGTCVWERYPVRAVRKAEIARMSLRIGPSTTQNGASTTKSGSSILCVPDGELPRQRLELLIASLTGFASCLSDDEFAPVRRFLHIIHIHEAFLIAEPGTTNRLARTTLSARRDLGR